MKKLPIVAIVGRANVGKSSLFNAILGRRETIVAKEAGTTRDSISARTSYKEKEFWLVDTAGVKTAEDDFELTIQEQISEAIISADIIWLVIEADKIISDEDRRLAKTALKSKKTVVLVVNKADRAVRAKKADFQKLGIKTIVLTSSIHKTGLKELLDNLSSNITKVSTPKINNKLIVSLLGRPNVGKSSLFNSLGKKQQAVVTSKAGTTRDINRVNIRFKDRDIEILDTAGIRRSGKIEKGVEHFSVLRSLSAIERSDICLMLIDANEPSVHLDQKISGMIKEAGKGLILVVTKWDSIEEKTDTVGNQVIAQTKADFQFVPWAPLILTSSITGQNVTKIFDIVLEIANARKKTISTPELNRWLGQVTSSHPPAGLKNSHPKLRYMVQEDDPTNFKIFGTSTKLLHWSYKRYLEHCFREQFGFVGTAIKFWYIENSRTNP